MKNKSIKTIFATIPAMPLQKVNETRKSQRKTREFLLETKYQEMLNINKEIKGNEQNFLQYELYTIYTYNHRGQCTSERAGTRNRHNFEKL